MAYLGTLGRLVELKCPAEQSVSVSDGTTFEETLEGVIQAQVRPIAVRRQWGIGISTVTPRDAASLLAFALGEWGRGPFVWVSADAPVTNLLSPDVSVCGESAVLGATVSQAGPLVLPDGVAGRSLFNSNTAQNLYFGTATTPVMPGQPVTASAYLVGAGARMGVNFHDASGAYISNAFGSADGVAGSAKRLSVTVPAASVPANAASVAPFGGTATYGTRPAVTWTDQLFDWQPGEGCTKAVLTGLSKDVVLALRDPSHGRYANFSFAITEVG